MAGMTMAELIESRRGDRSYQKLADDAGGGFRQTVWQQWNNPTQGREPTSFPMPDTIIGMAKALNVSVTDVLLAAGRTLGLDVGVFGGEHDMLLPGAGDLPEADKFLLSNLSASLISKSKQDLQVDPV